MTSGTNGTVLKYCPISRANAQLHASGVCKLNALCLLICGCLLWHHQCQLLLGV